MPFKNASGVTVLVVDSNADAVSVGGVARALSIDSATPNTLPNRQK
jgi:hypothetical protein